MSTKDANNESKLAKIRSLLQRPTSSKDLMHMLNNKTKVLTYDQVLSINSIEELLSPYGNCIILYPNSESSLVKDPDELIGHWVTIFSMPGSSPPHIEYFDSFGAFPDEMIEEANEVAVEHGEMQEMIPSHILKLLINAEDCKEYWNETTFQVETSAVCGFWCFLRLKNNHLNEDQFRRLYYDLPLSKNLRPDLVVAAIIHQMFPEM